MGVDEQLRRTGDSQHKKIYFHPVVEFDAQEGHPIQFTVGGGATRKRPVIVDAVIVIYPKGRPDQATLNAFFGLWAGPLAGTVLGGGCLYGGVMMVFFGA